MTDSKQELSVPQAQREQAIAREWIASFGAAIEAADPQRVADLFVEDAWWRDLLVLSWEFRTLHTPSAVAQFLDGRIQRAELGAIAFDDRWPPTRVAPTADIEWIEALFTFETAVGRGRGSVRLVPGDVDGPWKGWVVLLSLAELKGFEEPVRHRRPRGDAHRADPQRETWQERREREREFTEADPAVLIVGAGHAGLAVGARLRHLGVPTLLIERHPRVGDNWRTRYRSLVLHDPVQYDYMPYLPYPPGWPKFTPKDKLADWLEAYASVMELNVWNETKLASARYDLAAGRWEARVVRNGVERVLQPTHLILATGLTGPPVMPRYPGQDTFRGTVTHSAYYTEGTRYAGLNAVVVGAANSGFDIARDLWECGANVTLVQRSSTYVMSVEKGSAAVLGRLFSEDAPPTEEADMLRNMPYLAGLEVARLNTKRIAELDRELLDGLERGGFQLNDGEGGAGNRLTALRRAGGYVLDVGCGALIADGRVKVKQGVEVERYTEDRVILTDGTALQADVVVMATGFGNMRETARALLGDEAVEQVKPVWGLDEEGELNTVYRPSGHRGLWFFTGGLPDCRFYSLHLGLQIKARLEGLADDASQADVIGAVSTGDDGR